MQKNGTWIINLNFQHANQNRKVTEHVKHLHFKNGQNQWQHGPKQYLNDEFRNVLFKFQTGLAAESRQALRGSEYKISENENAAECSNGWASVIKSEFRADKTNWWEAGQDDWVFA